MEAAPALPPCRFSFPNFSRTFPAPCWLSFPTSHFFISMKYLSFFLILFVTSASAQSQSQNNQKIKYPATARGNQVDDYFGTKVRDPYRWLENVDSADVHEWVAAENKVTQSYFSQIPYRAKLRKRIEDLLNYPR